MFPQLPEEMERKIWGHVLDMGVLKDIKKVHSIWRTPSEDLFKNSSDYGAIQINHSDFERLFDGWYEAYHVYLFRIILGKNYYECCGACYVQKRSKPCKQIEYEEDFENKAEGYWDLSYYNDHLTLNEINNGDHLYMFEDEEDEEDLKLDLYR